MKPYDAGYFHRDVCAPMTHSGSKNGILLIHGFTGTAAHMRPLADALVEKGYTVRTINLPGHAETEEAMAASNWQQWLQYSKETAFEMINELDTFTVCGLSMGGVLALLIAEQMKVDACVPISAPTAVQNRFLPLAGILHPLMPRIAWNISSEREAKLDQHYDFGYSGFPTAKGADLYKLICMARKNLFNISCPILCVQSDADETIWSGSADAILEGVSSKIRQKLWLTDVPHVCTLSKELPSIVNAIDLLMQRAANEKSKKELTE